MRFITFRFSSVIELSAIGYRLSKLSAKTRPLGRSAVSSASPPAKSDTGNVVVQGAGQALNASGFAHLLCS